MKISRVGNVRCKLGEGPLWDAERGLLYFVDVLGQQLWRHDPGDLSFHSWDMPSRISSLALAADDRAIVALATGLHLVDLRTGVLEPMGDPTGDDPETFLNDGKADVAGRFVVGSVHAKAAPAAALYSVGTDGQMTTLDTGFGISNGPCWSPDGATLYVADSAGQSIHAYEYDPATGLIDNRRLFADTSGIGGIPDGATVDARGRLWTAMCDGAKVVCLENGRVMEAVDFPTGFVSSVMFGGPDLDRLYVTSIDGGALRDVAVASAAKHGPDDLGGALFVIDGLGAKGLAEHRFGGGDVR